MNSKHIIFIIMIIGVLSALLHLRKNSMVRKENHRATIGILQTASHPALDAVREGFMTAIKKKADDTIDFVVRNGQGSVSTIHTIAQQFHAKKDIDGIFAIATPAAQAIVAVEKEKPICIAAVSVSPALHSTFSADNVCGVSDMIDVRAKIKAMKKLLPTIATVGILHCTAEVNSVTTAQIMVEELEKIGLVPVLIGVTSEADIESALVGGLRKVDAILTPTDNMVANAITLIVDIMHKANKPLIVSDNMLVKHGALMARGVDYYESGRQAGEIMLQIFIDGKKPKELSIISADTQQIFVNKQVAESLGIAIPDSFMRNIVLV